MELHFYPISRGNFMQLRSNSLFKRSTPVSPKCLLQNRLEQNKLASSGSNWRRNPFSIFFGQFSDLAPIPFIFMSDLKMH